MNLSTYKVKITKTITEERLVESPKNLYKSEQEFLDLVSDAINNTSFEGLGVLENKEGEILIGDEYDCSWPA
tara:strand:- start:1716 stop:1931 length:216 start_codon:yes stop_codon:yes gene_type:complete